MSNNTFSLQQKHSKLCVYWQPCLQSPHRRRASRCLCPLLCIVVHWTHAISHYCFISEKSSPLLCDGL